MTNTLGIGLGLLLAYLGAEAFIRGTVSVSRRFRIPPLVVGLTVIAWGTSAPELAVSLDAASSQNHGVSLGNVLGSNLFNVGVILGLSALIFPVTVKLRLIRFDLPILIAITAVLLATFADNRIGRFEGVLLLTGFFAYCIITFVLARKETSKEVIQEFTEAQPRGVRSAFLEWLLILAGLGILLFGADLLVKQSVALARALEIDEAVIGLTIVAAGTSLPELVTSLVAAARKEPDVAVGNIVGSNIFNLGCILGLSSTIAPIESNRVGAFNLAALGISAVILLPLGRTGFVLNRWEGLALLLGYGAYLAVLWP